MGNSTASIPLNADIIITFDDIIYALKHPYQYIIIHVLNEIEEKESCLIKNTLTSQEEIIVCNRILEGDGKDTLYKPIIIYGKNTQDSAKIIKKYNQMKSLGIPNDIYLYLGGIYEWLALGEMYDIETFPYVAPQAHTTTKCRSLDYVGWSHFSKLNRTASTHNTYTPHI